MQNLPISEINQREKPRKRRSERGDKRRSDRGMTAMVFTSPCEPPLMHRMANPNATTATAERRVGTAA